jgi:ATP-dependent helicase HrpB
MRDSGSVVLCAPPGSGKTTRVPRFLHDTGFADSGEILILEPRRLATRMAAARVAFELDETPGRTVGYSIRFENVEGPQTRIRFMTEAILARRIIQDPKLSGISAVILDEFHERHLATDLALALVRRVRNERRPDLKLIVMSATLDTASVAEYLGNAPVLSGEAERFETTFDYDEKPSAQPLHERVRASVSRLIRAGPEGDILVFLPGAAEIRQAAAALEPVAARHRLMVLPLHGDLSAEEQSRAVEPQAARKVILSTNVAESSITIPGITAVVDSGLARVAGHSSWTGLPITSIRRISRASAAQRAARASRTKAGHVVRLYTRQDFNSRPEYEVPEIKRADLSDTTLMLRGAGIQDPATFPWFDAPLKPALDAAESLLVRLGAVSPNGNLSDTGRRMLAFPTHPRLSRLILEGERLGVGAAACTLAALLSERDIRLESRSELGRRQSSSLHRSASSDLLELLDRFGEAEAEHFNSSTVGSAGLDRRVTVRVERSRRQLQKFLRRSARPPAGIDEIEESLRIATLVAFPDRVAKRRTPHSAELLLAGGGEARLSRASIVHSAELMVAIDAEEREWRGGRDSAVLIRLASAIESEWLAALFPALLIETTELAWNDSAGRVEEVRRTRYDQLVLEERTRPAPASEETSRLLAEVALARGFDLFRDATALPTLLARLELLSASLPEAHFPHVGEEEIRRAIRLACTNQRSLSDIKGISLTDSLLDNLSGKQRELLRREAPERITLKSGRSVKVHYGSGKPPWIESRLQDFFGMTETPSVASGRVPVVAHLLAPNGRAVQVTRDLTGFWERHYPGIRRELQRRYPRHAWPEL